VGMGAELLRDEPALFEKYVSRADEVTGLPITRSCLEGPLPTLTRTEVAQPALFSVSLALTEYARAQGITPRYVAGHSLGEYSAAVAAGALPFDDGLRIVTERGRLMAAIQEERPGAMAAVTGIDAETVEEMCRSVPGLAVIANYNTPQQIVVSGEAAAIDALVATAREAGADQAVRLNVGAAFHSPLMEPVARAMDRTLRQARWAAAAVPLVSNAEAQPVASAAAVRRALLAQITSPVRWTGVVNHLLQDGCRIFLELGSGRVLTGLVRQIDPDADAFAADAPRRIQTFVTRQAEQHREAAKISLSP
jgi:[acyl-carrier-protein] S-malonyltransferase